MFSKKEVKQWVRSELKNTELREKLDILEKAAKEEDKQEPKKGSEVECHLREKLRYDKRGDKNDVTNIGHRSSGSKEFE